MIGSKHYSYFSHDTLEKLRSEYKKLRGNKLWERGREVIDYEFDEYDMWQRGSVVMYELIDKNDKFIDSCSGFITDKCEVADLIEEVSDNLPSVYGVANEC